MRAKTFFQAVGAIALLMSVSGCAGWNARWSAFLHACADEHALKVELAQDRLETLKAELDAERKAIRAERELDMAALRADNEKRDCVNKSQFEESVRTKLALDVDQQLSLGQLQVNVDELKRLLADRDREYKKRAEALKQQPNLPLRSPPTCQAPSCCPSCGAPGPQCTCAVPYQPPMEPLNEADCAGTLPFRQQPPTRPLREPILPTEIPLMLPVKMKLGFTNANLEESKIRRTPRPGRQPLRQLRECKQPCGKCAECTQGMPCGQPPNCQAPPPQERHDSWFGDQPADEGRGERQLKEPRSVPPSESEFDPNEEVRRRVPKKSSIAKGLTAL